MGNIKTFIQDFIESERIYSEKVIQHLVNKNTLKDSQLTNTNEINAEFLKSEISFSNSLNSYKSLMTRFTEEIASFTKPITSRNDGANADSSPTDSGNEADDSLCCKLNKLDETEMSVEKMKQRRNSTPTNLNKYGFVKYSFEDSAMRAVSEFESNLDTDEDCIVVTKLQTEESRESSAQSDVIICEGGVKDEKSSHEHSDMKRNLQNTTDEPMQMSNAPMPLTSTDSLYLDDDTSKNIRSKIMAYSLSEADSDCFDKNYTDPVVGNKVHTLDYMNVSTALVDNGDTSTETESTIVSAVTKLQAGARGYLTRKRLGRTHDLKSSQCDESAKASFGNAAISESLEFLLREAAARRIQEFFRNIHRKKQTYGNKEQGNMLNDTPTIVDNSLSKKRSMLQRGVALRNNSTPDEGNSNEGNDSGKGISELDRKMEKFDGQQITKAAHSDKSKIETNKRKWIAMRQNSMPVQIDSEVFRVIPKHMRKKIKSADGNRQQRHRKMIYD